MIWGYRIVQFLIGFGELFLCFRVLDFVFERKSAGRKHIAIVIGVTGGLAVLASINRDIAMYSWLFTLIIVILIVGVAKYLYEARVSELFLVAALFHILLILFEFLFIFILGYIVNEPYFGNYITRNYSGWRMIVFSLPRILMLTGCIWIRQRLNEQAEYLKEYKNIFLMMTIIGFLGMLYFQEIYIESEIRSLSMKWFIYFFGITIFTISLLVREIYNTEKKKAEFETSRADLLEYNYRKIYESYQDNAIIYHDMKNQLAVLRHYIVDKKLEEALVYLDKLQKPLLVDAKMCQSGNDIIDFILNYKLEQAMEAGIKVKYDIDVIEEIAIGDDELCALLTNLLDNSIEACQFMAEEKRWIDMTIKSINSMLIISISNSCRGKPVKEGNKMVSSKEDKRGHGTGLISIQNVVNEYSGIYEDQYDDFIFRTNITLFY